MTASLEQTLVRLSNQPPRVLLMTAVELLKMAASRAHGPRAKRLQLALLAAELTTLAARRIRERVAELERGSDA